MREKLYTIEDIEALPEGVRAELVDGQMYMMAAPTTLHERICTELLTEWNIHIRRSKLPCMVLSSNVAVYLLDDDSKYLLPDLKVICDQSKLDQKGYHGAPDFVAEVLSPATRSYDMVDKLWWYKNASVKEYWIVDPDKREVYRHVFFPQFDFTVFSFDDDIFVSICQGFSINLSQLGFLSAGTTSVSVSSADADWCGLS